MIPSSMVVPGDILMMETGDLVAADGRLLEVHGFTVNESSLTGNPQCGKHTKAIKAGKSAVALADRTNMVFSGSLVTSGRAMAVVTSTGMDTEIGRIASLMNETKEKKNAAPGQPGPFFRPPGHGHHSHMRPGIRLSLLYRRSRYWTP